MVNKNIAFAASSPERGGKTNKHKAIITNDVVKLKYEDGWSTSRIAIHYGINESTVKYHLRKHKSKKHARTIKQDNEITEMPPVINNLTPSYITNSTCGCEKIYINGDKVEIIHTERCKGPMIDNVIQGLRDLIGTYSDD